jgi:hypothetical protein
MLAIRAKAGVVSVGQDGIIAPQKAIAKVFAASQSQSSQNCATYLAPGDSNVKPDSASYDHFP